MPNTAKAPWDLTSNLLAYENDQLTDDEFIVLFQHLIDTGMVWTLQGSYGRTARQLIESGECHGNGEGFARDLDD